MLCSQKLGNRKCKGGEQIQSRYIIIIICAFNFKMFSIYMESFKKFGFNFQFFQVHCFCSPPISILSKFTTHLWFKAQVLFVIKFVFIAFKLHQMFFCYSLNVSCILKVHQVSYILILMQACRRRLDILVLCNQCPNIANFLL